MTTKTETEHFLGNAERDRVLQFCCDILQSLNLSNWKVSVSGDPCDEGNLAEVNVTYGRHVATVYLTNDWNDRSDEDRVNVLVHEMMHILHYRVTKHMLMAVRESGYLPQPTFTMWEESVRIEAEMMADGLANCFGEFNLVMARWKELAPKKTKKRKAKSTLPQESAIGSDL